MNYYELSNTVTPDTIGYKSGLWQKRYVQIYRVLIVVWSVLTLSLLFGMFHRDDYSSGMIKSCLLLFFAGIIFLVLMLIAVVNISAKRTENWSLQDRHDYNLAMYRTRYRNNRQLQSVVLIVMAKQQLLMSNYDLAAQALAMVDINCVKLPYLRDYYFCNAAVLFLCDKPGWGWDKFLEEANEGKGLKVQHWMKPVFKYFVPAAVLFIYVYGIVNFAWK